VLIFSGDKLCVEFSRQATRPGLRRPGVELRRRHATDQYQSGLNDGLFIGFHGKFMSGGIANDENTLVFANPETGDYFHFIQG